NLYLQDFLYDLNPSYRLPSQDTVKENLLTKMFFGHIEKKLNSLSNLIDFTISLDGWTDNSGNSIYGFMALKENKVKEVLLVNGIQITSAIACITDNPSNMNKIKQVLHEEYPNIISIRCCIHVFNLIVKDIVSFSDTVTVCKKTQKLVNFFNASHIWHQ
ncbi:13998_t:CDS:2, partial [Cetraspora pellucida]